MLVEAQGMSDLGTRDADKNSKQCPMQIGIQNTHYTNK